MQSRTTWKRLGLAVAALGAMHAAQATNGYFPHGFGLKAKGMGGAAVATAQDGFAGVNNPAASAFAGNRWDLGAEFFMPRRDAQMVGMTPVVESGRDVFLIPEFGYNVQLSKQLAVGLTVYGNGGMNTSYDTNLLGGTGKLGVDLMQLIVAPTVAYQFAEGHSFGVSPLLVLQRFEAYGLQGFQSMSSDGANVTNRGKDTSTGLGVRFGYMGQVSDALSVGASYSPKINMSRFDKYAGLFAGAGDFDIPENYSLGMALKVTPDVTLALDVQRINYSKVPAIGNASLTPLLSGTPLGAPGGSGFGWTDVNVVKLGVQWRLDERWTLRAGYNHGDNPVRSADAMFNILAPGVVRQHITFGGTYSPNKNEEWTFAAWHGKRETVVGPSVDFTGPTVIQNGARIGMSQNGFGLQYSRKF